MQRKVNGSLRTIVSIGLMAALVFVGSMISVPIPTILDVSRLHLGNIFCLLAGFLLGATRGGLAAGIGSMLYDFTNPKYISSAPITFVNKFMMAFVCGAIAAAALRRIANDDRGRRAAAMYIAAALGALTYVVLYLAKSFVNDVFFLRVEVMTALIDVSIKSLTSLVNAVLATTLSVPLAAALRVGLKRAGLAEWTVKQSR